MEKYLPGIILIAFGNVRVRKVILRFPVSLIFDGKTRSEFELSSDLQT